MSHEILDSLLHIWQKRLLLRDWTIKAKFVRYHELPEGKQATIGMNLEKRGATISILDPNDYPPDCVGGQDVEQALVHELLHCHFYAFDDDLTKPQLTCEEIAISAIAAALVNRPIA